MTPSPRFVHSSSVDASPVSDRVVLYERQSRRAIVLNPTGTYLWNFLQTPRNTDDLTRQLQARFPHLDANQARQDIEIYLQELIAQKLIQPDSAPST